MRESVRDREVDGWMSDKRDFYQKEDINQGLRAIKKNNCSFIPFLFFFLTFRLFCFFPKGMQVEFSVSL